MQQSTNYKFNLPQDSDAVDISKINANFTSLDSLVKTNANNIANCATKAQLSSITIYDSLADLGKTATTALVDVFNAMKTPSRLMCTISGGSTSVYPAAAGVLTIDKTDANNGKATFTYGNGQMVTGTFSAS